MSQRQPYRNRLGGSTSPYLLQHANNPVDWHPWDQQALELARTGNKPILLSIGYSACHWCHVMAHESFEDPETADIMNRLFVNIKVDREERPDLDKIYQTAHQLLAQRPGGWPLTVFLTPDDQVPFFAGTYFPDSPRHGMPAFRDILQSISRAYEEHAEDIENQNDALMQALGNLSPQTSVSFLPEAGPLHAARRELEKSFDPEYGGFGRAPKFPHPANIEYLLRHWAAASFEGPPDDRALHMARVTLERIAEGGIFDQLGGGFFRYSVDNQWGIPHFEKMLYDNALLQPLYCDIWQITGDPLFADTARATADWVMTEMQAPQGGYYSSLDADSEGEEGKFYVWEKQEIQRLLQAGDYDLFACSFGLDQPPNFEGRWHLRRHHGRTGSAQRFDLIPEEADRRLSVARQTLLGARDKRVRPGCDDKILTSWNALMIKAMARSARVFGMAAYEESAERSLSFIRRHLWANGRLMASHRDGKSHLEAYLDDYAFLLEALLELLQNRWRSDDLVFAMQLADVLLDRFPDQEHGGFFFTADDHEKLIHRPKSIADDALPSGNAVAASCLTRLGHLIGDARYLEAAERTIHTAWAQLSDFPQAHCGLLSALREQLYPGELIVIRGSPEDAAKWQKRAQRRYAPQRYSLAVPDAEIHLPGVLGDRASGASTLAYRCIGTRCESPALDFETFDDALASHEIRRGRPSA